MGIWFIILVAIILAVAFPFKMAGKGTTVPHKKSDFRDNEFDDEIEDYGRMFDDDL